MTTSGQRTLPAGYRLLDAYEIRDVLTVGVATIRYAALADDGPVVVEEYFPARTAARTDGVEVAPGAARADGHDAAVAAFLAAAQTLARLRVPGVVAAERWARANGTGYAVTPVVEGRTLADWLDADGVLSDQDLEAVISPVLTGLGRAHDVGLLHRQISPRAIIVRADGSPVLRDFGFGAKRIGSARQVFDARGGRVADIVPGYAPLEQYSGAGREGPWTDVYSLAAVMYRCVAGRAPDDAPFRAVRDAMPPAASFDDNRDRQRLAAIDAALAVPIASRPQSMAAWAAMLYGDAAQSLVAGRAGRTSARGFGRPVAPSALVLAQPGAARPARAPEGGRGLRLLRWAVPAVAATVVIAVMTWVDTGVLRGSAADQLRGAGPDAGEEFSDTMDNGGVGPAMVVVPAGRLAMPCPTADCEDAAEPPLERIFERPFAVSKFEVTEADYALFRAGGDESAGSAGGDRPAVNVSWHDAAAYAAWLSVQTGRRYRLASDAEWEYAARAGGAAGTGPPDRPDAAAIVGEPAPVGGGAANAWGFHDMAGNVSEWVLDCADEAAGACQSRVVRGGSWQTTATGVSVRGTRPATAAHADVGFRLAAPSNTGPTPPR
ncbi:MAG: SUMF1/EgtB/PvdO family nonheme iron enzyme [Gammaproteobacteria bacterium]|nr:SUMF1/EgtB/PvdO family nonheme iron enzyme [Gammaproteobacteria bacterium]